MLQTQSGRIVLGLLGNLRMVGEYELAFRVAFAVYSIPILVQSAVIPTVSRISTSAGLSAVELVFISTSRWIYTQTVIALGLLWVLAPDITRVWLGPSHPHIAHLIRLWVTAYALCLAYSPGVAIARGLGRPWFEIWSYVAAVLMNISLATWWVPRYGTAGAITAAVVSFGIGLLVFVIVFHRRSGIPFGPWFRRELAPRALAGILAVGFCEVVLRAGPVTVLLPPPGWIHGGVALLLFMTTFALFFLPLGDTQRLTRTMWQMTAGALGRRHDLRAS